MVKFGGVAVVAVWVVMAAMLVQREAVKVPAGAPAASIRVREDWMGIYLEGKKVGYAMTRVEKTEGGYAVTDESLMELSVMGTKQDIRMVTHSSVDDSLALKSFDFSLKSGVADMEMNGVVRGKELELNILTAGRNEKHSIQLKDTPRLDSVIDLYLMRQGLDVGKKFHLSFFDPETMSEQETAIEVEAKEDLKLGDRLLPVYRVRSEFAGVVATVWINPEQGVIKVEGPMGFTFIRETKEEAMATPEGSYGPVDIIAMVSIPAGGKAIPEPRKVKFMKAALSGADLSGFDLPGLSPDGTVNVSAESLTALTPAALPVTDPAVSLYLKPEPYVQSDDPAIKKKAQEIIGGETDAARAAKLLEQWVYHSVVKMPFAGAPSAVEVLGNLKGDCKEHTVLFTALARSAGIPTRMDAGIVMMGGRFYYHAWPEVYLGRWISIDPTFGQFPADATHIRLVVGGPDKQVAILKVVGKLKVDIVEYR